MKEWTNMKTPIVSLPYSLGSLSTDSTDPDQNNYHNFYKDPRSKTWICHAGSYLYSI